ncbi:MAG: hypothetical protein ACI8XO_001202 [Verrucomicrobiales bacterium]|jgi:hypothetical protein
MPKQLSTTASIALACCEFSYAFRVDFLIEFSVGLFRAPPKTSCGLELDKIPAVFVAKAPTITR